MDKTDLNRRISRGVTRGDEVLINVDGNRLQAFEGETIAGALMAANVRAIRITPHHSEKRGLYCGMGLCHECLVTVDGQSNMRACMTPVQSGQNIELQNGFGPVNVTPLCSVSSEPQLKRVPLAVIGGGPAGLSAALAAAHKGVEVLVIDENLQVGGQIYRRMAPQFTGSVTASLGADYADGSNLLDCVDAMSNRITIWNGAALGSVFEGRTLAIEWKKKLHLVEAEAMVIATGAYDRPVAVPGWTLPGVMTCGGAQVLIKSQWVRPGRRVLVAGTGPLLLVVANQLLDAGVEVVAVAEVAGIGRVWGNVWGLFSQPRLLRRGLKYLRRLRLAGVPFLRRHTLAGIEGCDQVERATLMRVDGRQRPIRGNKRSFDVDTVLMGYGFVPNTDVTKMLGCRHVYDPHALCWVPQFDTHMRTDQAGIYVAGDCAGVAGVLTARQQGRLAGMFAACQITGAGNDIAEKSTRVVRQRLARLAPFCRAMERMYPTGSELYAFIEDDTVICRCEEVLASEIRAAIREGTSDINDIKKRTRAGMGYCQGANCNPCMAAILEREFEVDPDTILPLSGRPPIKPLDLALLYNE